MNEIDNERLITSLQTLVEVFGEEVEPFAISIIKELIDKFLLLYLEEEEENTDYARICMNCLQTIISIFDAIKSRSEIFDKIQPIYYPLINKIMTIDGFEYMDEGLRLLTYVTFYPERLFDEVWDVYDNIMSASDSFAYDYSANFLPSLDNIISKETDSYLQSGRVEKSYKYVAKYLEDEKAYDGDCINSARLISVIFQVTK
jgi:hypothetical protein